MNTCERMGCLAKPRRTGAFLAAAAVAIVLVVSATWSEPVLPSVPTEYLDVTARALSKVPPGTVIADRAPQGWSYLIFKSHPRVGQDSLPKISAPMARMASLLFTVMLARVEEHRGSGADRRYSLADVAVGVGTKVKDRDMVLSDATQQRLGANLGLIERSVLSGGEAELDQMRCIARSPTLMILDAPSFMLYNRKHHTVVLRYAILVDASTGALATLVWPLEQQRGAEAVPLGPIEWLRQNMVQECVLHVDADEFVLGIPTKKSFAMSSPPPGRVRIDPPEPLKRLAATVPPFTPEVARALENHFRQLLAGTQGPR